METILQTPTTEEKRMAVLAHSSILLTFVIGVTSSGIGTLFTMLIPLFIWVGYRDRSSYVAFHALQATVYQLALATFILVAGMVTGTVLALVWVIIGLLSLVLVGLLLIPIGVIASIIAALILGLIPLAGLAYGLVGAWEVYNTGNFSYRWVAPWLNSRL